MGNQFIVIFKGVGHKNIAYLQLHKAKWNNILLDRKE
jgi:hypothetical protein